MTERQTQRRRRGEEARAAAAIAANRRRAARYIREMAVMPTAVWHDPQSMDEAHDALIRVARSIGPVKERAL